ncbi:MAG: biotin/lipoyl-binding protein [Chloroflexota bacterium]|nr:biotin/lipoyl-binding protein [Chloroflexota bacterium]
MVLARARRLRVTVEGPESVVVESDGMRAAPDDAGRQVASSVRPLPDTVASRAAGQRRYEAVVDGWVFQVSAESAERAQLRERASRAAADAGLHVHITIRARIPGRVVRLWVKAGDAVEAGQRLLAIDAMKMENEVRAPRAGVIGALRTDLGQTVELGDALVALE